jgi:hypothetical protein
VLEGLRSWYLACLYAKGEILGMPSRAVDAAWHEMILMTREYHSFCKSAFGRYLHHSPEATMPTPMGHALARTLRVAEHRALTSAPLGVATVPLLFAVDSIVGIEDGIEWTTDDLDALREPTAMALGGGGASCGGGGAGWACGGGGGGCGGGGGGGGGCGGGGGGGCGGGGGG